MKTTGTPAVEWPPGGASSHKSAASPGRGPTDFGALLDKHQARTAVAEGPKKEAKLDKKVEHKSDKDTASAPAAKPQAEPKAPEAAAAEAKPACDEQPVQPDAEGQEQPTVETPVVVVDPLAELAPPVLSEPQQQPAPQPTAPVAEQPVAEAPVQQQPVAAEQVTVAAEAVATPVAPAAEPVQQAPEAAAPVTATGPQQTQQQQPAAPVVAEEAPAEQPVADDAQPQQPAARAEKPAQPQQAQPQQGQQQPGDQQPQKQGADQRPSDQPRAQAPVQPQGRPEAPAVRAEHHVAAPAPQAQAPVTPPAGTPAPQAVSNAAPQAMTRSVPLSRAAEAVENVIRLGSARGVTHARMSLRPADLGGVEIRLQQTGQGLVASVVADGVEAAQALQQAGADLRRQLEAHGIELQRLDISYSGDDRSGARSAQAENSGERRSPGESNDSHATDGGDLNPNDEANAIATLELPDGVLVDVLA